MHYIDVIDKLNQLGGLIKCVELIVSNKDLSCLKRNPLFDLLIIMSDMCDDIEKMIRKIEDDNTATE